MTLEEYKKEVDKNIENLFNKANEEEKELLNIMVNTINDLCEGKQKLIDYLKEQIHYIKTNFSQVNGNYFMLNDKLETYEDILSKIEKSDKQ